MYGGVGSILTVHCLTCSFGYPEKCTGFVTDGAVFEVTLFTAM